MKSCKLLQVTPYETKETHSRKGKLHISNHPLGISVFHNMTLCAAVAAVACLPSCLLLVFGGRHAGVGYTLEASASQGDFVASF